MLNRLLGLGFRRFFRDPASVPAVQGQDEEPDDSFSASPFVAYLLEMSQASIGAFDMVVSSYALASGTVQVCDHLREFVGTEHGESRHQIGVGCELWVFD